MSKIVRLTTKDGPVFVEIEDHGIEQLPAGWDYTSSSGEGVGRILDLSASLDTAVARCFSQVREGLSKIEPDEIEIELGLKLSAEAGGVWVLAKAGGEANIRIKAKWAANKQIEKDADNGKQS